jgi:hypothetical protein
MKIYTLILLSFCYTSQALALVPLTDNVLFAFEKCKALSVDLEKGQLKEAMTSSFDIHCLKKNENPQHFQCTYFDTGSNNKVKEELFTGGSDLGVAELKNGTDKKIKFLIGKSFAAFESGSEQKVCAGIYLFEKEALKRRK